MHVLHPLDLPGTPTIFEEHSVGAEALGLLSKDEGDSDYEVVRHFRNRVERRPHQHTRRGNATLDFTLNLFGPHCARNVGQHQRRPGVQ